MSKEMIPVTLWLAGRGYRIKIQQKDEELVRLAVKVADEKINELRHQFAGKDDQDFVAMCLLMYASDQIINDNRLQPVQQYKIEQMIERIERATEK